MEHHPNIITAVDLGEALRDGRLPPPAAALIDHMAGLLAQYGRLLNGADGAPEVGEDEKKFVIGFAICFEDGDTLVLPRPKTEIVEESDEALSIEVDLAYYNKVVGMALAETAAVLMDNAPKVMQ
ncbi:protein of unknown function [Magnetospirillum sp. XM-1]|uniref:hypothetical protein n=1 Tax=Magnetospirillum sp. XM-1 TaxID=1663591 RepID=UPI00073DEBF9|nr:hypothetical protein [Magnetospirillum sp. XM-1]CUW38823.1 protein of unknown function [Magnetospirillum sp. XM-1]